VENDAGLPMAEDAPPQPFAKRMVPAPPVAAFLLQNHDHTVANLLRSELARDPQRRVASATYDRRNPLNQDVVLEIETFPSAAVSNVSASEIALEAVDRLLAQCDSLRQSFAAARA
jgi:DNA-directed RNA polymerase subunit L